MVLTPQENLILVYVYNDIELLQCTAMCQNNYIKSLLPLSVGHSQIRMTKITGTFQCDHGKANQQTPLRDKGDAELLSICSWLGPSTKAEQFLTKNGTSRNCESLPLSRASIPFIFFLPSFHCLLFPLGGAGGGGGSLLSAPPPSTFESNMKLIQVLYNTTKGSSQKRQSQAQPSRRPDA